MGKVVFSVLFFIASGIYFLLGHYAIFINKRASANHIFFAVCVALGIWAFGFSIAAISSTVNACMFWRRFSAFGWSAFYSILLHFILVFTDHQRLLRRWWSYLPLYLPAVISILAFAIPTGLNPNPYRLVDTAFGWTNIAENNAWDWFFHIYYVSFILLSIGLTFAFGRKATEKNNKRQAMLIFWSFLVALVLGTMTDVVLNAFFSLTSPQMAPVILLLPVGMIYYSMRRYGLMNPKPNSDELIVNDSNRVRVYNYLSIVFISGGFLNFLTQYLVVKDADFFPVFLFSGMLMAVGVTIRFIAVCSWKENIKEYVVIAAMSCLIPVITLHFSNVAGISVWSSPLALIIFSLLFNSHLALISLAASSIFTQVLLWMLEPVKMVQIGQEDYIARIGLLCIGVWLAYFVHRVYIQRLQENANQMQLQKLVASISSDFVTVNALNLDEKVHHLLERTGRFIKAERSFLNLLHRDFNCIAHSHAWCDSNVHLNICSTEPIEDCEPLWMHQLQSEGIVDIPDVSSLPESARIRMHRQDCKSFIAVPIESKGKTVGFLGCETVKNSRIWRDDQKDLLQILSNILSDALTKVNAEKEINQMAYYDQLTKLPNRLLFRDRVDQAIHLAERMEKMVGIIFLDIDAFKAVNDTMGHESGDELLKIIASRLSGSVRLSDTVSRFGGDEFLIMLNGISSVDDIETIADSIMDLFRMPFILRGQEFFLTASAGIAVYPPDGRNTEELVKNADIAMYKAKENGNGYVLCSPHLKDEVIHRMYLTNSLYRALDREELLIHYQPQISLYTQEITGMEALLRWQNPEFGLMSPDIFIPLAEQTGLINSIGLWVIKTACQQNKTWQEMGLTPARVAVNVSIHQFKSPDFVQQVSDILQKTDLHPQYLELEITESVAIQETTAISDVLKRLKKLGVSISIDDFGTEYSSLSRLRMLPIDRIKMDMQFVRGIEGDVKDQAIANAIIDLAKSLGLHVIAEGVETQKQLDFLRLKMCDEVQGF